MTDTHDTAALVARARAALEGTTPGPWTVENNEDDGERYLCSPLTECPVTTVMTCDDGILSEADANFTAAARTLVPDMADALTGQAAEIARLRKLLGYNNGERE
jgi:hypothetical protein